MKYTTRSKIARDFYFVSGSLILIAIMMTFAKVETFPFLMSILWCAEGGVMFICGLLVEDSL